MKTMGLVRGVRTVDTEWNRRDEGQVLEPLEAADLGSGEGADLVARALTDGTYLVQIAAAFHAGEYAEKGRQLPPAVIAALQPLTRPPVSAHLLGPMAAYALRASDLAAMPPRARAAACEELVKQDPRVARVLLQHWDYQFPDWAPEAWMHHPAFAGTLQKPSAAHFYFRVHRPGEKLDPARFAAYLMDRVTELYTQLQQTPSRVSTGRIVAELQGLAQRIIDLDTPAIDAIEKRPDLVRIAGEPAADERTGPGYNCLLDVLRSVRDERAISLFHDGTRRPGVTQPRRVGTAGTWLVHGVRYPHKAIRIYEWPLPPVTAEEELARLRAVSK